MVLIRTILLALMLMMLYSSHAVAYQYGYYAANPYNTPRAYYPYARPPPPYYPPHRYRARPAYARAHMPAPVTAQAPETVQATATIGDHVNGDTTERDVVTEINGTVESETWPAGKSDTPVSSLSGKKQAFMTTLLPYIEQENVRLLGLHKKTADMLGRIESGGELSALDQQQLNRLAKRYRVKDDVLVDKTAREELLRKIDIIPSSLALAQAANESAWGESRFAQEANNLFGIWTYDRDKGIKPKNREQGKKHLVRIFDDFEESVRYYMYTLNSHPAYQKLREIRQQLRASDEVIDGHRLAAGLEKYSAKGQAYIDLIQGLIMQNEWARLDLETIRV